MANERHLRVTMCNLDRGILGPVVNDYYFVSRVGLREEALNRSRQEFSDVIRGNVNGDARHADSTHFSYIIRYQSYLPGGREIKRTYRAI